MSIIEIRHLRKEFDDSVPLKDVNCTIKEGETVSIIGPSGTGKSTFLRCINRLETPDGGSVIVDGTDVCDPETDIYELRKKVGMVFQSFNLFGHKMAVENIMMPLMSVHGMDVREAYDEAMLQLRKVGLEDKARLYPDELSGGQQQRVAIARELAMHPKIILFDEPTSALDPSMVSEVISVIESLDDPGLTMLIVTHEMRVAREVSDRVFYMDEGEIYEQADAETMFENPRREKTRQFIFRLKNWEWESDLLNADAEEMKGSLESFCRRQFIDRSSLELLGRLAGDVLSLCLRKDGGEDRKLKLMLESGEYGVRKKLTIGVSGCESDELLNDIDLLIGSEYADEARRSTAEKTGCLEYKIK